MARCSFAVGNVIVSTAAFWPTAPTPPAGPNPPHNPQNVKLATSEVGYGEDANAQLSRRLWATYFAPNPKLFEEVFGYPPSELPPGGPPLSTMRLWRNEFIAVT